MEEVNIIQATVLFLSLDPRTRGYIESLLEGEGYVINSYTDIPSFMIALENRNFDLIILDVGGKENPALCKEIRAHFMLRHIPILLIIEKDNTIEKIKGIYAGADDYVEKPPRAGELLTRIKANLWRAQRDLDANPLTKLPGNSSTLKELEKRLKDKNHFCIAYTGINHFKEYNDHYGFEWGDSVIKHTSMIIYMALKDLGQDLDFLGHIGGIDFVFITLLECIEPICNKIIYDFDNSIPSFYSDEDREKGNITIKTRKGELIKIPPLSICIGVVSTRKKKIIHSGQMIQIAADMRQYAKSFNKSIYLPDRRQL